MIEKSENSLKGIGSAFRKGKFITGLKQDMIGLKIKGWVSKTALRGGGTLSVHVCFTGICGSILVSRVWRAFGEFFSGLFLKARTKFACLLVLQWDFYQSDLFLFSFCDF